MSSTKLSDLIDILRLFNENNLTDGYRAFIKKNLEIKELFQTLVDEE